MKLGDQKESLFDDRIDLELSPSKVENLLRILEREAMDAPNYWKQGSMRKIKDYFQARHDDWREQRDTKNRPIKSAEGTSKG